MQKDWVTSRFEPQTFCTQKCDSIHPTQHYLKISYYGENSIGHVKILTPNTNNSLKLNFNNLFAGGIFQSSKNVKYGIKLFIPI